MLLLLLLAGNELSAGLRLGSVRARPLSRLARPLAAALSETEDVLDSFEEFRRFAMAHRGQPPLPGEELSRLLGGVRRLLLDTEPTDQNPATLLSSLSALHLSVENEEVRGIIGEALARLSGDVAPSPCSLSLALQAAAKLGVRSNGQLAALLPALSLVLPRMDAAQLAQSLWALGACHA